MKKNKLMVASAIVATTLFLTSCNDNNSLNDDVFQNLSTVEAISLESAVEEVESVVDSYSLYAISALELTSNIDATGKTIPGKSFRDRSKFFPDCTFFEEVTDNDLITTTITFPDDCEDKNGDIITGTIIIEQPVLETDKSRNITFNDFSINGYIVNGTKIHTYTEINENGNPQIEGTIDIAIETDEGIITKTGARLIEITAGGDTDIYEDDEKTITGSHTFTDAEGNIKAVEITTPLIKSALCPYISQGIKTYTENGEISVLDYGDGTCDNIATLTEADGTVTEIALRKRRKRR